MGWGGGGSSRDGMGRVILSFPERVRQELNRGFNYEHSHK